MRKYKSKNPPKKAIGVLDRALIIISTLEETQEGFGLTEVANRANINKTTCYRILQTLMNESIVETGVNPGTYRLGIRLLELGSIVQRRINLRQIALPALTQLTIKTGDTSFLCIPKTEKAICIERIEGEYVQVLALKVGDFWPLYQGAAPRAILASLEDKKITNILKSIDANKQNVDVDKIWNMIDDIRRKGYSTSFEDVTLGVASIGAPICNHDGEVVGAISLSSTIHRLPPSQEKEFANHVVSAAKSISRSMGCMQSDPYRSL